MPIKYLPIQLRLNTKEKTLSLILAVLMVMTAVPLSGMATGEHEHEYLYTASPFENEHYRTCKTCRLPEAEACTPEENVPCGQTPKCTKCEAVLGDAVEHTFTEELVDEKFYVAGSGDCQHPKQYYKNCANPGCDAKPTDLATADKFNGPENGTCVYTDYVSDNNATCKDFGTKTAVCDVCGNTTDRLTDEEAGKASHVFTAEIEDPKYLVAGSVATCEKGLEYYKSCANEDCDEKGTETFTSNVTGGHTFIPVKNQKHWIPETCTQDAAYYNYCTSCLKYADELEGCENEKVTDVGSAHGKPTSKDDVRRPLTEDEITVIRNADCLDNAIYSLHCKKCGEPTIGELNEAKEGIHFYEVEGTALNPGHRDLTKLELVAERIEPTCTTKGQEAIYRCPKGKDCPNWKESQEIGGEVIPAKDHSFAPDKTTDYEMSDSCTGGGKYARKYCTACETSFFYDDKGVEVDSEKGLKEKTIDGKRHVNNNSDDLCDVCGYVVTPEETCTCICHKTGFMYIVALFLKLVWKFTGAKPYCNCGKAHY